VKNFYFLALLLGLAHGISDASAGFLIAQSAKIDHNNSANLVLSYNIIAFGGMGFAGWLGDLMQKPRLLLAFGLASTTLGLMISGNLLPVAIVLMALGTALYHPNAGSLALTGIPNSSVGVGLFAAFGVIGLAIGSQHGTASGASRLPYVIGLISVGALIWVQSHTVQSEKAKPVNMPMQELLIVSLLLAVALRSTVWTAQQYEAAEIPITMLWLAVAACLGKLAGGFLADKFGWFGFLMAVVPLSAISLSFGSTFMFLLIGVFLLQSATPVSISMLWRLMPEYPGLAVGLVLGAAVMVGGIPLMIGLSGLIVSSISVISILAISAAAYWLVFRAEQFRSQ